MEIRILGPLEVVDEAGRSLQLPGGRPRVLLLLLCTEPNRVVPSDRLIDELWIGDPPQSAPKIVHRYISLLRSHGLNERLETRGSGYLLRLADGELDAARAAQALTAARGQEPGKAADLLRAALALWRGGPLAEAAAEGLAATEIRRLEDLRLLLLEERIEADLQLGFHGELVGELEQLVREHPLRERFRAQLMLALYRSGRQAEALAAYRSARSTLVAELGIEPTPELHELELRILRQDPELGAPEKTRTGRRRSRRPPRAAVRSAVAAALLAAGVAVGLALGFRSGPRLRLAANTVVEYRVDTGRPAREAKVGTTPRAVALYDDAVFVANYDAKTVTRLSANLRANTSVGTATPQTNLAAGAGAVWAASSFDGVLSRIDPASGRITASTAVAPGVQAIAAGEGAVWLTDEQEGNLIRVDPVTMRASIVRRGLHGPSGVAVGASSIWVADSFDKLLLRLDPHTTRTVQAIPLELVPDSLSYGDGAVWATNPADNSVTRIDAGSDAARLIAVGTSPVALAVGGGRAWVVNDLDHTLSELDATSGNVLRTVTITKGDPVPTTRDPRPPRRTAGGVDVDAHGNAWVTIQSF